MINELVTIDTGLKILRSGIALSGDTVSNVYVVLDREECERYLGHPVRRGSTYECSKLMAHRLTGWDYYRSVPGRSFAGDPELCVHGRKVLIVQRRGLDV